MQRGHLLLVWKRERRAVGVSQEAHALAQRGTWLSAVERRCVHIRSIIMVTVKF
jgi:hypothetical protein